MKKSDNPKFIMKIKYNAPIILSYTFISMGLLFFFSNRVIATWFSSPATLSFSKEKYNGNNYHSV